MHELAIAESIVSAVATRASECEATRVRTVRLRIGEASAIVADSLTFCFEMLSVEHATLAGAQLVIERVPHVARCRQCAQEFAVVNFVVQCPTCAIWDADVLSGTELQILDMEIDTALETAARHSSE